MYHRVEVRKKSAFLRRMMIELAGGRMSLEGDLSRCTFQETLVLAFDEMDILKRNTTWPEQDFIVLRLEPEHQDAIFKQIMSAGLARAIIHIQIERAVILELGVYDNFHSKCVLTGPGVGVELLAELQRATILWKYEGAISLNEPFR